MTAIYAVFWMMQGIQKLKADGTVRIERAGDVDGFVALTQYYARHAARHFGLPPDRVHRITMGIRTEATAALFSAANERRSRNSVA